MLGFLHGFSCLKNQRKKGNLGNRGFLKQGLVIFYELNRSACI
jgi:hypothetical protein